MRKPVFMPIWIALLLAGLCLCGLAGCARREAPPAEEPGSVTEPDPAPEAPDPAETVPDGPLSQEELRFFNEEFFNGDYLNIRNQFLSSVYETAADVNLFELFYCGTGWDEAMPEEERAAFQAAGGFTETDVTKVSTAGADLVLTEYLGLALAETNRVGLDRFTWLEDYDAYYLAHGDTNYRMEVAISSGERKDGLICLYYDDTFFQNGWKCVTLRETAEGGYQFVSNLPCDGPVS